MSYRDNTFRPVGSAWTATYELSSDAPPAMSWKEYESLAMQEWDGLLNGIPASDESTIHKFLEQNPSFIPGAFSFPTSGHCPIFGGVLTKPVLQGTYIPDFIWLATATDRIYPMFIEIETPQKHWFAQSGQPRAEWTQARDQLIKWKSWILNPVNQQAFKQSLGIPAECLSFEMHPQFILIYGSRKEFEERPELRSIRAMQEGKDEFHITFERLKPDANAKDFITLKREKNNTIALVVPPTVELGPAIAHAWIDVKEWSEAALRERRMSPERRSFLASRFPYWNEWARNSTRAYRAGDRE